MKAPVNTLSIVLVTINKQTNYHYVGRFGGVNKWFGFTVFKLIEVA